MKFRSRTAGKVQRLASITGHIILIGDDFVEVPEHMEADAYAQGCVSEALYNSIKSEMEQTTAQQALASNSDDRLTIIKTAIHSMMDSSEEGLFTAQGLPNLKILSARCGFTVSREEVLPVWEEIASESAE